MFRQLLQYTYGFLLAISCCVIKHETFQVNSSSILISPCLKLLQDLYLTVDSIIHAFSSSLGALDPKRKVSSIIESFWLNKERVMLLIF